MQRNWIFKIGINSVVLFQKQALNIMNSKEKIIKRISEYSNNYFEDYLNEWTKELMLKNWWEGMKLLLNHSYYQGRKDIVSEKVKDEAFNVLKNYIDNKKELKVILSEKTIKQIETDLRKVIGKGKIGKGRDVEMTLEILNFPKDKSEQNITRYSITEIKDGKIRELERETNKFLFLHSIWHRRDFYKPFKGKRKKIFYFKEKKYAKKQWDGGLD